MERVVQKGSGNFRRQLNYVIFLLILNLLQILTLLQVDNFFFLILVEWENYFFYIDIELVNEQSVGKMPAYCW